MAAKGNVQRVLQLSNKAYTAGVIFDSRGICVQAAPILQWMIGRSEAWIKMHCRKHHIVIQETEQQANG